MTVFETYQGRPVAKDMLPGGYDLSKLAVDDEWGSRDDEEKLENHDGVTLIGGRKSGDQGFVIYISDDQKRNERRR